MSKISRFLAAGLLCAALPLASVQAATYTAQERANIKVVEDYFAALDASDATGDAKQKVAAVKRYVSPDYIQHDQGAAVHGKGREGLIRLFESGPGAMPPRRESPPPAKVLAMMADGDLVIQMTSRSRPSPDGSGSSTSYIVNMFRVQNGKLAEHWGVGTTPPGLGAGGPPPGAPAPGKP